MLSIRMPTVEHGDDGITVIRAINGTPMQLEIPC